jgi:hypothetical protein
VLPLLSSVVLTCLEVRNLPVSARSNNIYAVQAAFACAFERFRSEEMPLRPPAHIPALRSACGMHVKPYAKPVILRLLSIMLLCVFLITFTSAAVVSVLNAMLKY